MKPIHFTTRAICEYLQMRETATVPEIANRLKMPTPTVTGILNRLVKKGLVGRSKPLAGRRGRPRITYRLRLPKTVAAFHWDGTQLAGGLFDRDLRALKVETVDVPSVQNLAQAAAVIDRMLGALTRGCNVKLRDLPGLALSLNAVSIAGQSVTSSVIPWANENLGQTLADTLRMPVRVLPTQNLTQEYRQLSDPPPRSMCLLRAGDGVSAHMIDSGQIVTGRHSLAGELGHVTVDRNELLCGCGRRGCLETLCSGPAIRRRGVEDLRHGVESELRLHDVESLSPRLLIERIWNAWERGDTFAHALMDPVFDHLAWGLGLVANLFDPDVIIAGGYVLKDRPAWVGEIERRAQRWILHAARRRVTLTPARASVEDDLRVAACGFHSQAIVGEIAEPRAMENGARVKRVSKSAGKPAATN